MRRIAILLRQEEGSSPVEFVLVGTLLTLLTLAVLQFGLAVYIRNLVHDAAVEGAYHAALADTTLEQGADRVSELLDRTIGDGYDVDVMIGEGRSLGFDTVDVTVHATLPLLGLLGPPRAMEVTAHAPVESFD